MFDSLLVANRGEIAVRILRSAKTLGLRTVAVYSDADFGAPHVTLADSAVRLGPPPARDSYLRGDAIITAALELGVGAIHPGYGLLSEDAAFAAATEAAGLAFVGPTPQQLTAFGAKDAARALAMQAGVPLAAGSGLLESVEDALDAADKLGFPVMLKSIAGGGGIGMERCADAAGLANAFPRVTRLAQANFGSGAAFVERLFTQARHVEVQLFGDGLGRVLALSDRDCTLQRRNQKVIEEAPASCLPDEIRHTLHESAIALAASVNYRSAGTAEFIYDGEREELAFLEVNARLQVEHPVTEARLGIDLVAAMLRLAQGESEVLDELESAQPRGCAVEARIYAENPDLDYSPSPGLITEAVFPTDLRVDGWVTTGTEVPTSYDPLLAKVIASGDTREQALARLAHGLAETRIRGIATNLGLLHAAVTDPSFVAATHTTSTLAHVQDRSPRIVVVRGGTMTTVQDWPGRLGMWDVGVPPSGPMDDLAFRLANRAVGNPEGAPGLETTLDGTALRIPSGALVCVTGAPCHPTVDGDEVPMWECVSVPAGAVLELHRVQDVGLRSYVSIRGGIDVPEYLGSASTFTLGQFGGHGGRALATGDVLAIGPEPAGSPAAIAAENRPAYGHEWQIGVLEGPHAAPDFFTARDIEMFYATNWEVHFNSARTGVRLVGPRPEWARADGGEAGLHPSNLHDTAYSVGSVDFTGDTPIVLGPDGPSLGGFACPAVVAVGERWKLGQLRPADNVRFVPVNEQRAGELRHRRGSRVSPGLGHSDNGVLGRREQHRDDPAITWRRSGDDNLLIEYGPMELDLRLRARVHALAEAVRAAAVPGVRELTPGIRSLQLKLDPDRLSPTQALAVVERLEDDLPATRDLIVPSRRVRLPLSWDDPATREAIARYMAGVRDDAPWCPWNIEFIRRVNGLEDVEQVRKIVYDADYLVLGLGDVYLGAPVATPLDPRHRLVTTKYNPARTWTAENSVGIGGAYLCIYGMEGPGGYQFVGRTTQVWSRFIRTGPFADTPYLLRFFDRISWFPVAAEELLEMRAAMAAGRLEVEIEDGSFALSEHLDFLDQNAQSIADFKSDQRAAFSAERAAWTAAGEFDVRPEPQSSRSADAIEIPAGAILLEAPIAGSIWRIDVSAGSQVDAGQQLVTLEAMKMETAVDSPTRGTVLETFVGVGDQVRAGAPLLVLDPSGNQ